MLTDHSAHSANLAGSRAFRRSLLTTALLGLGACTEGGGRLPSLEVAVAPLTLPGITDACFGLTVYDGADPASAGTVWQQTGLCSSRFGNGAGGDISYVGTCVAVPEGNLSAVELVLEDLYDTGESPTGAILDPDSYQNPCPDTAPCVLLAACYENADTAVEFNLVIMRDASQGFFDIAVNFEDLFCSAKLDCVDELLHRPGPDGARDETAVLGFACTSGGNETHLYLNDIVITCDGEPLAVIDPESGPGQIGQVGDGNFEVATYQGLESFPGFEKCFWNAAIGLDLATLSGDCSLTARATASETVFDGGPGAWSTPANSVYPVITWTVPLSVGNVRVCGANPLNGDGSGVVTAYTDIAGESFLHHRSCADGQTQVNGSPTLEIQPDDQALATDEAFSFALAAGTFVDPDGDLLSYSYVDSASGAVLGWLAFDPETSTFSGVAPSEAGTFDIAVTAIDPYLLDVIASFTITVSVPNSAPTVAVVPAVEAIEGIAQSFDLGGLFSDAEGDAFELAATLADGSPLPEWITFDPQTNLLGVAAPFSGGYVVRIIATDVYGAASDPYDLPINVMTNQAPGPTSYSWSVYEDEQRGFDLRTEFGVSDPEGRPITCAVAGSPTIFQTSGTGSEQGCYLESGIYYDQVVGVSDQTYSWTGSISDGFNTVQVDLAVTVYNVNRDPTHPSAFSDVTVGELGQTSVDLAQGFADPDQDPLSYSVDGGPAFVTVDGGSLVIDPASDVDPYQTAGTYPVTVTAYDGWGGQASGTVNVVVTEANRAPVISPADFFTIDLEEDSHSDFYSFDGSIVTDPDGDTITYSFFGNLDFITQVDAAVFSIDPTYANIGPIEPGSYIVATDSHGAESLFPISGQIRDNPPPYAIDYLGQGTGDVSVSVEVSSSATINVDDLFGHDDTAYTIDTLSYSVDDGGTGHAYLFEGTITLSPQPGEEGTSYAFVVSVDDGHNQIVSRTINVTVPPGGN